MLIKSFRLVVFLILLHSFAASGQGELKPDAPHEISLLVLSSIFLPPEFFHLDSRNTFLLEDKGNFEKLEDRARNNSIITHPAGNSASPQQSCLTESQTGPDSDNIYIFWTMYLPASCFLTPTGQGGDDPSLPPDEDDEESPVSDICPICQEPLSIETMEMTYCCGRLFHTHCLTLHLCHSHNGSSCPWCRRMPWRYYNEHTPEQSHQPRRRPLRCQHCRSTFCYTDHFIHHLRLHHNYCWYCPVATGNAFDIRLHTFEHGFVFMCASCNWPAMNTADLFRHVLHDHSYRSPRNDCFCFEVLMPYHEMRERGISHYACSICNALRHNYQSYLTHMQDHELFLCLCCNNRFRTAMALQEHAAHCFEHTDN